MTDMELLRKYAGTGSDEAFRLLVERHLGLVRGTALRQLGNLHQADEVSHAVFIALARKAGSLPEGTVLAGWLFRATRFAAAKLARDEGRRIRREKEAAMTHVETAPDESEESLWPEIEPHLNGALESLSAKDRDAVLLRFFAGHSFAEVGQGLGATEDAAKMRVGRALEKLRGFFRKRGYVLGAAALMSMLSTRAAVVAPEAFVQSVAAGAVRGVAVKASAFSLAAWLLRHLRLERLKFILNCVGAVLVVGLLVEMGGRRLGWFGRPAPAAAWPPPAQQWRP